jgi:hypothetical protein
VEFRSQRSFLGLPLLHVCVGRRENGVLRRGIARGWIAIGDIAFGIIFGAGGIGCGIFSFGGLSIGLLAFGGLAAGGLTFGGLSIGTLAIGGAAIGLWAIGGVALAWYAAVGGVAFGRECAVGGVSLFGAMMAPDRFIGCVRMTVAEAQEVLYANGAVFIMTMIAVAAVIGLVLRRRSETL